jgi:hypothetical protein
MRTMRLCALLLLLACRSAPAPRPVALVETAHSRAIETISLDDRTRAATFKTALEPGVAYLLKAQGRLLIDGQHGRDAEFAFGPAPSGFQVADEDGGLDVGIDVGRKQVLPASGRKPAPPSDKRLKWFGAFRSDHVYYLLVTGEGRPLSLQFVAPAAPAGTGSIAVSAYRLTPVPPPLGAPQETVLVPAREKVSVRSSLVAKHGEVYLLQAVGEVQVGGPGAMGDAEFHDYHPDGRGFNEGEAGVDFGVGIDEPTVGADHDPRHRKWGAFRTDHSYFMLYAGRGQPIALNYHDTGGKTGIYKDNDGFLPVSIFVLP